MPAAIRLSEKVGSCRQIRAGRNASAVLEDEAELQAVTTVMCSMIRIDGLSDERKAS